MFVKVCGLKTRQQVDYAIELGYDAVGFVMHKPSKRYIDLSEVQDLINYSKGKIKTFAVGVSFDEVSTVAEVADFVQISEVVNLPNLVYATDKNEFDVKCAKLIYDASRGSGVYTDFPEWVKQKGHRLIISGGLRPENVAETIRVIKPYGVDVSSGVEKEGVKDFELMKQFINAARGTCA
jgi:phosphoribosylanthranilate isomerase